jgi:hypothetical protein
MLGFIAEHLGVRFSYWAVIPIVVAALLITRALAAERATGTLVKAAD